MFNIPLVLHNQTVFLKKDCKDNNKHKAKKQINPDYFYLMTMKTKLSYFDQNMLTIQ